MPNFEKYNKLHDEIMKRLEAGEITTEQAKEVNDLAFEKYITESIFNKNKKESNQSDKNDENSKNTESENDVDKMDKLVKDGKYDDAIKVANKISERHGKSSRINDTEDFKKQIFGKGKISF